MKLEANTQGAGESTLAAGVMAFIVIAGIVGVSIGLFYVGGPVLQVISFYHSSVNIITFSFDLLRQCRTHSRRQEFDSCLGV